MVQQMDVTRGQRLLVDHRAECVVEIVERIGRGLGDPVHHVVKALLDLRDFGLGKVPAGNDLFEVVREGVRSASISADR